MLGEEWLHAYADSEGRSLAHHALLAPDAKEELVLRVSPVQNMKSSSQSLTVVDSSWPAAEEAGGAGAAGRPCRRAGPEPSGLGGSEGLSCRSADDYGREVLERGEWSMRDRQHMAALDLQGLVQSDSFAQVVQALEEGRLDDMEVHVLSALSVAQAFI
jgi:hypothetical protein